MDLNKAETLARTLMAKHDVGHIPFAFDRSVNRIGALHRVGTKPIKLTLSRRFVELLTEDEVRDTILHEIAHAINQKNGPHIKPHGPEWKAIARSLGARPTACKPASAAPKPALDQFCPKCQKNVDGVHRLPQRVYWHRGCGRGREDAFVYLRNGKPVPLEEFPQKYQTEKLTGVVVRKPRPLKRVTLDDFFRI